MKIPFLLRLRMWFDYLTYTFFLQKEEAFKLLINLAIFILSVFLLQHELFPKAHGDSGAEYKEEASAISVIAILIIIKFLWEAYMTQRDIKSYFHIQHSILRTSANIVSMLPSDKEKQMGFVPVEVPGSKPDLIFISDQMNRHIQTTPLTMAFSNTKNEHIRKYLELHGDILLQYLNYYFFSSLRHNRQFTNDLKLCLSNDFSLSSKIVHCHTGGYYDSFLTNQITGTTLIIKDRKHTTITTEHIFPSHTDESGNMHLTDVTSSQLNNHFGCSTLGFTKDHNLVIWEQAGTVQFNRGLFVPTGSGSSNASDVKGDNFQEAIIRSMERELIEESNPTAKEAKEGLQTIILGFYRWVSRGGKPEFVGITKLPGEAKMYQPDNIEIRKEKKTNHHYFKLENIDRLPTVCEQIRQSGRLSVPLFVCLRQLEYMYQNHQAELKKFLFEQA